MSLRTRLLSEGLRPLLTARSERVIRGAFELRRRLAGQDHVVAAFLRIDDPYSLFLARRLADLSSAYTVKIDLKIIGNDVPDEYFPARGNLAAYARRDGQHLATLLDESFADQPAQDQIDAVARAAVLIANRDKSVAGIGAVAALIEAYWSGDANTLSGLVAETTTDNEEPATRLLHDNTEELLARGHYNSAMLHYGGEWYWGVDRLHHLLARLERLDLARTGGDDARDRLSSLLPRLNPALPVAAIPTSGEILEYFHSFRSPYAYLALERTFVLADRLGLTLDIRPVLPMVQQGMALPREKVVYIVRDANREARRLGIPFGHISDPRPIAERCIALFIEARELGKEREWLLAVGRAAWAEGIDLTNPQQRRNLALRVGLSNAQFAAAEQSDAAVKLAEQNRARLTDAGLWGVPSFVTGEIALWGQDRLGVLIHAQTHQARQAAA